MINIECTPENQEQILRLVEQALKGVDANITTVDEEATLLDVAQYMSYNMKQQRVYLGRIEGRAREIRLEVKETKDKLAPFFELATMMLDKMKEDEAAELKKEAAGNEIQARAGTFSREELSKMP